MLDDWERQTDFWKSSENCKNSDHCVIGRKTFFFNSVNTIVSRDKSVFLIIKLSRTKASGKVKYVMVDFKIIFYRETEIKNVCIVIGESIDIWFVKNFVPFSD